MLGLEFALKRMGFWCGINMLGLELCIDMLGLEFVYRYVVIKVVSLNPTNRTVYSINLYVIKFV
jgi:hypothetical protein